MTDECKAEIKRLMKAKDNEVTEFRLLETIKTTKLITKVETSLAFTLVILNVLVLAYWYIFTEVSITTFLLYYIIIGGVINILSIVLHNKWENSYITKKTKYINNEISLIKMEYDAKIKKAFDSEK